MKGRTTVRMTVKDQNRNFLNICILLDFIHIKKLQLFI